MSEGLRRARGLAGARAAAERPAADLPRLRLLDVRTRRSLLHPSRMQSIRPRPADAVRRFRFTPASSEPSGRLRLASGYFLLTGGFIALGAVIGLVAVLGNAWHELE